MGWGGSIGICCDVISGILPVKAGLSGLRAWLLQRLSATYLGGFFLFVLIALASHPHIDAHQWRAWLSQPYLLVALAIFIVMLLIHGWVGVRDVIIDYAHPLALRIGLLSLAALFLMGCGWWAAYILLQARGV